MNTFVMNGVHWRVRYVEPSSLFLVSRVGIASLATTDPTTRTIYISKTLNGSMLKRVLIHELGHCVMISYGLTKQLHQIVKPEYWIDAEEFLCNFICDYGKEIFDSLEVITR